MGAPVMVDDGGSIRIKLSKQYAIGVMDSLFDVTMNQSEHEIDESYTKALILWLDKNGDLTTKNILNIKRVVIITDLNLNVEMKKTGGGTKLKLKVSGNAPGPIFESKQHKKKRSYTVLNGGRIKKVIVDVVGSTTTQNIPGTAIYASVVVK